MKKYVLALFAIPVLTVLTGCRNQIEVDGQHYDMLNEREISEIVAFARATLEHNSPKLVRPSELVEIKSKEPEFKINYRGDCYGDAAVIWDLSDRKYEVVVDGVLNETSPLKRNMMLRVMKKFPDDAVVDFSKRSRIPAKRLVKP